MRMRRAHEHREGLPGHRDVVGVAAGAADQPQVLEPRQRATDEGAALGGPAILMSDSMEFIPFLVPRRASLAQARTSLPIGRGHRL